MTPSLPQLFNGIVARVLDRADARLLLAESQPPQTNLARIRSLHRISQSELARRSGVGIKSIQAYEQRVNRLNKASGTTLRRLATTLGCPIESLLEFEPQVAVDYLPPLREHPQTEPGKARQK